MLYIDLTEQVLILKAVAILGVHLNLSTSFVVRSPFVNAKVSPGACFSKVPIINGPGKLSPFSLKIEVSIVLHVT